MVARWMFVVCASAVFAAAVAKGETQDNSTKPVEVAKRERSLTAIQADVRNALTAEAKSRRSGDNTRDVVRLIELYREMAAHPQHDTSNVLKEMGQQVRLRLVAVRDHVQRRLAESNKSQKKQKVAGAAAAPETRVLGQQLPQQANNAAQVGQGVAVTGISRPAATVTDYGPELVALIEATISPETWNINGGNGAIVYYAPLHVLVVSAPGEVHAQIGDALGQLNAAQRRQDGAQVVAGVNAIQAGN